MSTRLVNLGDGVRRKADDGRRPQLRTGVGRREIVLSHVHSTRPAHLRKVHAVVHDHLRAVRHCRGDHLVTQRKEGSGRQALGAQLQETCAAVEERAGEVGGNPAGSPGGLDIDDGVKG
jgi:hypothetical protein